MKLLQTVITSFGRLYPFERGKGRIFYQLIFGKRLQRFLERIANPIRMKDGFYIYTYKSEYLSLWMRFFGGYENYERKRILKFVTPGSIFLDIGANLGVYALSVAAKKKGVLIYAFEPNPSTFQLLAQSIRYNNFSSQIIPYQNAVSNKNQKLSFLHNNTNTGDSAVVAEASRERGNSNQIEVEAKALDEFPEFQKSLHSENRRISCIKMDIQGAELLALQGMGELLKEHKPVMFIEVDDNYLNNFGAKSQDIYTFLESLGYREIEKIGCNHIFKI